MLFTIVGSILDFNARQGGIAMKRLFVLLGSFLFALPALAVENPKNPDHLPSIAFSAGYADTNGNFRLTGVGSTDTSSRTKDIEALLKIPTSNNVTIFGALSVGRGNATADETSMLFGTRSNASGYAVRVGFIKYFGR